MSSDFTGSKTGQSKVLIRLLDFSNNLWIGRSFRKTINPADFLLVPPLEP